MAASNTQVQQYVNERMRPRAEQLRALYLAIKDDQAVIDDVYANVSDGASTFVNKNEGGAQWSVIQDACVRSLPGA